MSTPSEATTIVEHLVQNLVAWSIKESSELEKVNTTHMIKDLVTVLVEDAVMSKELENVVAVIKMKKEDYSARSSNRSTGRKRKAFDPSAPTKPLNPFQLFCAVERPQVFEAFQNNFVTENHITKCNEKRKLQFGEISKILGQKWAELSEERKQGYINESNEQRRKYDEEIINMSKTKRQEKAEDFRPGGVEPYFSFLFQRWEQTSSSSPGLDGGGVQQVLWDQWCTKQVAPASNNVRGPWVSKKHAAKGKIFVSVKNLKKHEEQDVDAKKSKYVKEKDAFEFYMNFLMEEVLKVQPQVKRGELVKDLCQRWQSMGDGEKRTWFHRVELKESKVNGVEIFPKTVTNEMKVVEDNKEITSLEQDGKNRLVNRKVGDQSSARESWGGAGDGLVGEEDVSPSEPPDSMEVGVLQAPILGRGRRQLVPSQKYKNFGCDAPRPRRAAASFFKDLEPRGNCGEGEPVQRSPQQPGSLVGLAALATAQLPGQQVQDLSRLLDVGLGGQVESLEVEAEDEETGDQDMARTVLEVVDQALENCLENVQNAEEEQVQRTGC